MPSEKTTLGRAGLAQMEEEAEEVGFPSRSFDRRLLCASLRAWPP